MRRVDQAVLVAAGDDLYAAVRLCGRVHRGPEGDLGIAVERRPPVLVPRQVGALVGRLVHEHGAEERDRRALAIGARADGLEDRFGEIRAEERVVLKLLDFAVIEPRALEAEAGRAGILIGAGGAVELHEELVVIDVGLAEHDGVDAILHFSQLFVVNSAKLEVAEVLVFVPLGVGDEG